MMHGKIEASTDRLIWLAVRLKQPKSGRRFAMVDQQYRSVRSVSGVQRKRAIVGTGRRVFMQEYLIRRAGFECFNPVLKVYRKRSRYSPEKVLVPRQILHGWMFVALPPDLCGFSRLMDLDVVMGVAGTGGRVARVHDDMMNHLLRKYGSHLTAPEHERFMQSNCEFGVGDEVQFCGGSFDLLFGKVTTIEGANAKVLVNFFGREIAVDADTSGLVPV